MKITFTKYDKDDGILCDHCGTYIVNVYKIEINGIYWNLGSECFKKLEKDTNLSQFGKNWIQKQINKLLECEKQLKILESGDNEKIDKCFPFIALREKSEGQYYESREDSIKRLLRGIPVEIKDTEEEVEKKTSKIKIKNIKWGV